MKTSRKIITAGLVLLILVLALFLRLNFILNHHQVPVVWDAAGYHIQAREFFQAFRSWPDRALFEKHLRKAYEMALPKCELYPLFISGVYLLNGVNFPPVRVAQAIMGTLSLLLLYLIARLIFNRTVALVSLLAGAFYIPFILSEGRLLTETLAIFVLLLTNLLLVLSLKTGKWRWIVLSGMAVALLMISRTFFQYIFPFYWLALLVGLRVGRFRWWLLKSLLFLAVLAAIIVPRYFWTGQVDRYHRRFLSGSWRNGLALYCGIYPPNRGLQTDSDPGGEILRSVRVKRRPGGADDKYFKAYRLLLTRKPLETVPVLLSKGWLFYRRAYNDFLQSYLLSPEGINIFNRSLLILGLFGLALCLGIGPHAWPFLITAMYAWGITFLADAESRYALPVMPFMIAAAVWFIHRFLRGILSLRHQGKTACRRLRLVFLLSFLLFCLSCVSRPPLLGAIFSSLSFPAAYLLWIGLSSLFIFSLIPLLLNVYRPILLGWRRWIASLVPPLFLILIFLSALKVHPRWHQWKVRLAAPGETIRQTISLPPDLSSYRSADLKLDLVSGPDRRYNLDVKVDGKTVRRFIRGLVPDPAAYIAHRRAFPIYLREQQMSLSQVRQWFTVPLDIRTLAGKKRIEVELKFSPLVPSDRNYIDLYGDYGFSSDPYLFEGPTFSQSPGELSLYKYLFDLDWRLWRRRRRATLMESAYGGPDQLKEGDLSPARGRQTGNYRIILLLSRKSPRSKNFPVAVKNEEYLTEKSILANYYNLQIWEVNPWKRTSNRMLLEAAHAAPGKEGGFRLVVYSDTDGDGKPDKLIKQSPYFTVEKKGEWSSWQFTTEEKRIFVGMAWPPGSQTRVYYNRSLWPDDVFPERMFYKTGRAAVIASPVLTNLRISFLPPEKKQVSSEQ